MSTAFFVGLEARLDRIQPATRCMFGLSLRACVMAGAVFMACAGCVMLVTAPIGLVKTVHSFFATDERVFRNALSFWYVHLYLLLLHTATIVFLLYAVPLAVLALRSAYNYETTYMKSYFQLNVTVVMLVALGSLFNLLLDRARCVDPHALDAEGESCSLERDITRLLLALTTAVIGCYLAWITYCYRREMEQGTQLEDDVAAAAGAGPAELARDRAEKPMGRAADVDVEVATRGRPPRDPGDEMDGAL